MVTVAIWEGHGNSRRKSATWKKKRLDVLVLFGWQDMWQPNKRQQTKKRWRKRICWKKELWRTISYNILTILFGGFNPFEKYARQIGFIFPNFRGETKKCLSCHHLDEDVYPIKNGDCPTNMVIFPFKIRDSNCISPPGKMSKTGKLEKSTFAEINL